MTVRWVRSVALELWGLFVDDGNFATGITVWLGVVLVASHLSVLSGNWGAIGLFAGLAVLLIENVLRYARRWRK